MGPVRLGATHIKVVFDGATESSSTSWTGAQRFYRLQVRLTKPEQEPMDRPGNVGMLVELG